MISFITSIIVLIAGYFIYGKFVEKFFCVDEERVTPAVEVDILGNKIIGKPDIGAIEL